MLISTIEINATKETVWDLLKDRVFNPGKYIPGVLEFECVERAENEYIRTLCTETDDVVELILLDHENHTIISSLVRHSFLKGTLSQKIETSPNGITLTFEQDREITIEELKTLDMQPALDDAVLEIKNMIEEAVA